MCTPQVVRKQLEESLAMPKADVRAALRALDDAAGAALELRRKALRRRHWGISPPRSLPACPRVELHRFPR